VLSRRPFLVYQKQRERLRHNYSQRLHLENKDLKCLKLRGTLDKKAYLKNRAELKKHFSGSAFILSKGFVFKIWNGNSMSPHALLFDKHVVFSFVWYPVFINLKSFDLF